MRRSFSTGRLLGNERGADKDADKEVERLGEIEGSVAWR